MISLLLFSLAVAEDPCNGVACPMSFCPSGTTATIVKGTENNCCGGDYKCVPVDTACSTGKIVCTKELQAKGMNCIEGKCVTNPNRVCCEGLTAACQACVAGVTLEAFCQQQPATQGCDSLGANVKVGGAKDKGGCLTSAGFSWCPSLATCVRPWEATAFDADGDGRVSETEFTNACAVKPKGKTGNPASLHCRDMGGESVYRKDAEGNVIGYCRFANGSECEEWALFQNQCSANSLVAVPVTSGLIGSAPLVAGGLVIVVAGVGGYFKLRRSHEKTAVQV